MTASDSDIVVELRELSVPDSTISDLYRSLDSDERALFGESFLPEATHNDENRHNS